MFNCVYEERIKKSKVRADRINGVFASLPLKAVFTGISGIKANNYCILTSEFYFIGAFMPFIKYKVI
jgi:hypothetical protein